MKPIKLIIKTNSEKYPIFIGKNLITKISSLMVNNSIKSKKCLLLVDRNVPKNFISEIKKKLRNKKVFIYNFNANEKNKNQTTINSILEILLNRREIVCWYGEILKHSIISRKKFFKYLDQNFDDVVKLLSLIHI